LQKTGEFRKIHQIERMMLMFTKNDLKTGMLAETQDGHYYLFFSDPSKKNDVLKETGLDGAIKEKVIKLERYDDNLLCSDENDTIVSIYGTDDIGYVGDFINYKLLWERRKSPYVVIKHVKDVFLTETGEALILFQPA